MSREYIVHLRGGLDLPICARSPSMACEQVHLMHATLGGAIVGIESFEPGDEDAELLAVRGRCTSKGCSEWLIAPAEEEYRPGGRWARLLCAGCRRGKESPRQRGAPKGRAYHRGPDGESI